MSEGTRQVLDVLALIGAVELVARHRKISMRVVSTETGIGSSTLTRMTQGQKPDADALVSLLCWLNSDAGRFTKSRADNEYSVNLESE